VYKALVIQGFIICRSTSFLFSYGNSAYICHSQAKDFKSSLQEWEQWLEGLPENVY
jgi:hypothetical protein